MVFMDSNILTIMDQLAGAVNIARTTSKMIYVSQDGMGWFYSGKLPAGMNDFYIVYADSSLDQIGSVPRIDLDAWHYHLSQTPPEPTFSKIPEKKGSILEPFKKYLITYCAFSPYISLAITFLLATFLSVPDFWTLGFYASACCSPLSFIFSLSALQKPKNSRVAVACCMLASDAHLLFYAGLWLISFHGVEIVNPVGTAIAMMASLLMSGLALLLMYDNDLQKKVDGETTKELTGA